MLIVLWIGIGDIVQAVVQVVFPVICFVVGLLVRIVSFIAPLFILSPTVILQKVPLLKSIVILLKKEARDIGQSSRSTSGLRGGNLGSRAGGRGTLPLTSFSLLLSGCSISSSSFSGGELSLELELDFDELPEDDDDDDEEACSSSSSSRTGGGGGGGGGGGL